MDYRGAYLITANHVIDPGQTLLIEVFRTDERRGTPIPGTIEILGRSRDADLAVLRIDRAPWLPQALQIRPSEDPVPIEGKAFVVGCANGKTPRLAQANMTGQ
ncbi:MAG: trypsin-like peptidase domain-containing protein, partial [Planctomycetales bacterium]|nr:trypsin-like peptidase domain-containing protein [Planctomycetales bacterium]